MSEHTIDTMGHAAHHDDHAAEVRSHIKGYIFVFIALALLTVLTVTAASLDVSHNWHIVIALVIATVKASLVVAYFMHMISERRLISTLLYSTLALLVFMISVSYVSDRTRSPRGNPIWNEVQKSKLSQPAHGGSH